MKNPLSNNGLFATPEDMKALMQYCERCFSGNERVIAITCAAMALNLAHKLVQQQIEGEAK
jgi:hypothetical protein